MRAIAVKPKTNVAVQAEQAIAVFGESLGLDCRIEFPALTPERPTMRGPVTIHMVNRQELVVRFAATLAFTSVGGYDFGLEPAVCLLAFREND